MRLSRSCDRRVAPYALVCGLVFAAACAPPRPRDGLSLDRATAFLVGLFDPELGLLPEYAGASRYWLFHDNYLAAKVLAENVPAAFQNFGSCLLQGAFQGLHLAFGVEDGIMACFLVPGTPFGAGSFVFQVLFFKNRDVV